MATPAHRIPRTRTVMSLATRELVHRLEGMAEEETVSYEELSALIGMDVQQRRDLLATARRYLLAEHHQVFEPVVGYGLKCLTDSAKVAFTEDKVRRLGRAAHRAHEMLAATNPDQVTPAERTRWLVYSCLVGTIELFTHAKTVTHLEAHAPPMLLIPPLETIVGLFHPPVPAHLTPPPSTTPASPRRPGEPWTDWMREGWAPPPATAPDTPR